ncbi:MAG: divalent-cation tolerance protein CutA [Vampirovibrionales bacterium]|nr:divalent-cation tolerance protein CutA [Vampirovibrionales bacterium]
MTCRLFQPMEDSPYCVVLVSCATDKEAATISRALVREKLAACVNRLGPAYSTYFWEGQLEEASEYLLMVKTTKNALPSLSKRLKALHSYDEPEVVALPILGGSSSYLNWLGQNVHL